jgi:hypothetical protein
MNREKLDDYIDTYYPEYDSVIIFDDLNDAFVGIGVGRDGTPKSIYDLNKIYEILMERDGMSYEEAVEFSSFNIEGTLFSTTEVIYLNTVQHIEDEMS